MFYFFFFFSSRRRHTRWNCDWSSDVCSSDLTCWRLLQGIPLTVSLALDGVRDVITAWAPLVVGAGVAQISGLVDTFLGSFTGEGGLASLGYAQLVQVLPISLFGVAVTAVAL